MTMLRSMLFAPASDRRKMEKVFTCGADAVILDLEDAVAIGEKPRARAAAVEAMAAPRTCRGYVRVNGLETPYALEDIEAAVCADVDGLVVPKIESATDLATIEWLVGALEAKRGLTPDAIDILPIIETGRGVAAVRAIAAAARRTRCLSFGAGDYAADMGLNWTRDEDELAHARAEIALASRANGLAAPIDTVWIRLGDDDGLRQSAKTASRMGYQGKLCIHPDQLLLVHAAFTPDDATAAHARRVVAAFEQAEATGSASIQVDGVFVDYPIVERARRILAVAEASGKGS